MIACEHHTLGDKRSSLETGVKNHTFIHVDFITA